MYRNKQWETQALCVDVMYYPIEVTGVTGGNAKVCNGTFYALPEVCGGWVKYKKKHADIWLIYVATRKQWCLQDTDVPENNAYAYTPAPRPTSPDKYKGTWLVWNVEQKKFIKQENMYLQPDYSGDW